MWIWLCLLPQGVCNDRRLLLPTHSRRPDAFTFVDSSLLFIWRRGVGRAGVWCVRLQFRKAELFSNSKSNRFKILLMLAQRGEIFTFMKCYISFLFPLTLSSHYTLFSFPPSHTSSFQMYFIWKFRAYVSGILFKGKWELCSKKFNGENHKEM